MQNTMQTIKTLLLQVANLEDDKAAIQKAAKILIAGGLVAIPTETVYGLGANALDPRAVRRIFFAKGRPQDNPLIIHIVDPDQARDYAQDIPNVYFDLCRRFSPGPLTVILKKKSCIPAETSGGLDTVAIRIPAHPVARAIIRASSLPIAAPSANLSGSPSPTTAHHCIHDLWGRVEAIVDAGACQVGVESTVISLAEGRPCLLRPGAITPEMLREVLGNITIHEAVTKQLHLGTTAASPGMKYKHYAPKANLTILNGTSLQFTDYVNRQLDKKTYALCFDEDKESLNLPFISLGSNSVEQAKNLFSALRELDEKDAQKVFVHCPEKTGVGLAVYNRLIRAAAFDEKKL